MVYFIAWMVLFPISQAVCERISQDKKQYSSGVEGFASLIMMAIWLGVGVEIFKWAQI